MLQSQLFTKTQKEIPSEETNVGTKLLLRAGFIQKIAAGVYAMLPPGFRVLQKIENIIVKEMDNLSAQRIQMNALVPRANWEKTGRWKTLDVLYKVKGKGNEEYGLGATHEEEVTPLVQKHVLSYKDFPFSVYQIQAKFRDELRVKSGLLRTREFLMKDLYSFHVSQEDCDQYYERVKEAYFSIFKKAGLVQTTFLTLASGGTFSKFSHEFQTWCDAGEDTIYLCDNCGLAINNEIKSEFPKCPECGGDKFQEKKAIEVGNIFKLGTKYSAAFDFEARDTDGGKLPVLMACYGIGLTRLMGTIAETWRDDAGLIWPESVTPFDAHLLKLSGRGNETNDEIEQTCQKIYQDLQKKGFSVLYDDRDQVSAGEKFADADLLGIPWRLVVSEKTLEKDSVEVKKRKEKDAKLIEIDKINNFLSQNPNPKAQNQI